MVKYYCRPIKLYVCFICRIVNGCYEVLLFGYTNGVLLFPITIPLPTGRNRCAYIDSKQHPWLGDWLVEKKIAQPTRRYVINDGYSYEEFKFNKEI